MGRAKQLSPSKRRSIVELKKANILNKDIAIQLRVSQSAVSRILFKVNTTGNSAPKQRSGRPAKVSTHTKRLMYRTVNANPFITSKALKQSIPQLNNVSKITINDTLRLQFKCNKPLKKPMMTKKHLLKRLQFCREHRNWTTEQWRAVMWSDESTFELFGQSDRFVRIPIGADRCNPRYTQPTVKHPASVMIWGCISGAGRGGLCFLAKGERMNAIRYQAVLEQHLLPFINIRGTDTFMQDGATCHTARTLMRWLQEQGIPTLKWPPNSPDLNPIENLWDIIKRRVALAKCTTIEGLKNEIRRVWVTDTSPDLCKNLVDSMPRRIAAVLKNNGHPSKY